MASKQRLNVLVVDRDEATILELKDFLTEEGYQAHALGDPDRGIDLLKRIRATDSDICVICMTGAATVDAAVRTLKSQAFDYLEKPLAMEELRAVIQAAIREKGLLVDIETRLNQEVGRRLRERRLGQSLTLKQLANRTGLSVSLISQIELGKSAASMSTLHKLSTSLQVRMTYFFETI
jgi:DNA-binding NtrC family response regulator